MKILHVTSAIAPRYGGPSEVAIQLTRAQRARGHDSRIFTLDVDGDSRLDVPLGQQTIYHGVPVTFFRTSRPRRFATSWHYVIGLIREAENFDIIHIHSLYLMPTYAAAWIARFKRVPYILRPHGTYDHIQRPRRRRLKAALDGSIGRDLISNAAGVHFTSDREAFQAMDIVPQAKAILVSLGAQRVAEPPALPSWWPGDSTKVILYFGRLTQKKRPMQLLEAWAQASDTIDESWTLAFVGPDGEITSEEIALHAADMGCSASVLAPGLVVGGEKRFVLENSSVFVLASESENFGVAAAEALAHGLPVILSQEVGISNFVQESGAGFVLDDVSIDGLVEGILRWTMQTPEAERAQVSRNARLLAESSLSWSSTAAELEAHYERVAGVTVQGLHN